MKSTTRLEARRGLLAALLAVPAALGALCPGRSLAAGAAAAPDAEVHRALYDDLGRQLESFDRGERWKSPDSAMLAWSCGQQLAALLDLYQATGERKWLDGFVRYADAMFANLTPNRDGFLSWRTGGYSSLHIKARRTEGNSSAATIEPAGQRLLQPKEWARELRRSVFEKEAAAKADWEYQLTWQDGGNIEVKGATTGKVVATVVARPGEPFEPLPGVKLTVHGRPAAGDKFILTVDRPKDFDFAVHDGVVLTPLCRFIFLVRSDEALKSAYGDKTDSCLKAIEKDLIPKWDRYWRQRQDRGFLVMPTDEALDDGGITLPHNQYLALGHAMLWLHRITGKEVYREKATKMARFFKANLRLAEDHYEWNYWDAAGEWDKPWDNPKEKHAEDTGHGSLDIGFVVDAAEAGIVFDQADLKRFANTFLKVMWNGSLSDPTVGGNVVSAKTSAQSVNLQDWVRLGRTEPQVLTVCSKVIPKTGSLKAKGQLLRLLAERKTAP